MPAAPRLDHFSRFLAERMGLHFAAEQWPDLMRGVGVAAGELGFPDPEQCIDHFLSGAPDQASFDILASHLTVGETYFFREPRSFDALAEQILPPLIEERRRTTRLLRIWSAGCCTGEEPYSLAILLDQMIGDLTGWTVTILGTDINRRFLARAESGVFGDWSFRIQRPHLRELYFRRAETPRNSVILPRIRRMVSFAYLNLAQDHYPSVVSMTNAMDVIFCRNVLMYFTPDTAQKVVAFFHRSLLDNGILVTSAVEASGAEFPHFAMIGGGSLPLFRKLPEGMTAKPDEASADLGEFDSSAAVRLYEDGYYAETTERIGAALGHPPTDPAMLVLMARALANQGQLEAALERCREAVELDKVQPAQHYLLAMIQQERGELDEAVSALKRVLFLDRHHALAHFSLAELERRLGRNQQSRRHYRNALDFLENQPLDAELPDGDGMNAGRLREIIRATLAADEAAS